MNKLHAKLAKIMSEISYIQKDQQVSYGSTNYKAATERAVLNAVRPKLVEQGLLILPVRGEVTPIQSAKGAYVTSVGVTYAVIDSESGESMELWSTGQGHDSSDKGAGKAFTYATKYLLLKMFLLETGDDPDIQASDQNVDDEAKAASRDLYDELIGKVDTLAAAGRLSATDQGSWKKRLYEIKDNWSRLTTAKSIIDAQ